jgi:N-acyl-D-aspartate/D-glutamate deacylase
MHILLAALALASPNPATLIRGATVYDGTGVPGVVTDVLLDGDSIKKIGKIDALPNQRVIDGTGLVVAPGFIDLHTHSDTSLLGITVDEGRANTCYVVQGVTTIVTGNCGAGPVDTAAFFKKLDSGAGSNVIHQVPHNSVREKVMGNVNRAPTAAELKAMEELVEKAMTDGAWGLATGLIYNPGTYAKTDELTALAKIAAKHGGHYASHIRNESTRHLDAIQEAITIGKDAGCPVHISHIKSSGAKCHGQSGAAITLIENARKQGLKVTADQYPYIASSTSLRATLIPTRYREGSQRDLIARLDDPETGPKLKAAVQADLDAHDGGGTIQIARYSPKPEWQGQRISAIAKTERRPALDIVLEIERAGGAQIVNFGMSEEDVRNYMKQPWVATASDGSNQKPGDTVPHPRSYGTFSRKIGRYSIDDKVIPLEQAIRSASGLPADILNLKDRGYVKEDCKADVVVFDPKTYRDAATYDKPHQLSPGVKWLFVNGQCVIEDGKHKPDVLAGRPLRHESAMKK